jgi:hypothetical protein
MTYKDVAWCGGPHCKNKCRRRLSTEDMIKIFEADELVEYINFCDDNGELIDCA